MRVKLRGLASYSFVLDEVFRPKQLFKIPIDVRATKTKARINFIIFHLALFSFFQEPSKFLIFHFRRTSLGSRSTVFSLTLVPSVGWTGFSL